MDALKDIAARAEAATEGPWELAGGNEWLSPLGIDVGSEDESSRPTLNHRDAEFIAHARTDIPKLVAALKAAQAVVDDIDDNYSGDDGTVRRMAREMHEAIENALAGGE